MKVIVVSRFYNYYEESYTKILGVRETDTEADELIAADKQSNQHPLMSADDYFSTDKLFAYHSDKLYKEEKNSPKSGGWVNKYRTEQISKKLRPIYDKLVELSGDKSYPVFWQDVVRDNDDVRILLMRFFVPAFTDFTIEQIREIRDYYIEHDDLNPNYISYHKDIFDTKE